MQTGSAELWAVDTAAFFLSPTSLPSWACQAQTDALTSLWGVPGASLCAHMNLETCCHSSPGGWTHCH